jgi:hypothetical protein
MTRGLQDKNFAFGGMHSAFDKKIGDLFRKPSKIRNNCKGSLYIILNVLSNKTQT